MKTLLSLVVLVFCSNSSLAFGSPITLTFSGIATGTLGATSFTSESFTVTSEADTSSVFVTAGPIYDLPAISSVIDIDGFSPAVFTDATSWTDPQGSGDILFNDATLDTGLLGFTELFAGLEAYQFQTSIGPISGGFPFTPDIFETFQNIPTSAGLLTITITSDNSFTAVLTPEPTLGWFMMAGLSAIVLVSKRRILL